MRPQKTGLDYFPFDVGLLKDKKLRRPKMKYGYLATEVYISLLTLLYSDKGYYIPYETQKDKDDCIWYVLDCLQGKYQPDANTIADVIEELVACELFSGDHYPKNITSKRSQSVYYSATVERKSIVIDDSVWDLSLDEMKNLSEKHIYYLSKVSRSNNGVNRPNNSVNRSNNPQSKVKKSKVKKNIVVGLSKGDYTDLCNQIGKDNCDFYIERVKAFREKIPTAKFDVKTTILKWYRQDKAKDAKNAKSNEFTPRDGYVEFAPLKEEDM